MPGEASAQAGESPVRQVYLGLRLIWASCPKPSTRWKGWLIRVASKGAFYSPRDHFMFPPSGIQRKPVGVTEAGGGKATIFDSLKGGDGDAAWKEAGGGQATILDSAKN